MNLPSTLLRSLACLSGLLALGGLRYAAAIPLSIGERAEVPGQLLLQWPSRTGKVYTVESDTALGSTFTGPASQQQATPPGNHWWMDKPGPGESLFYRVVESDPGQFTGERAAAHAMNTRLHRGNNFMAAKSMNRQGAPEDYALLNQSGFSHCRIGFKMDEVCGPHPDYAIPADRMRDLQNMVDWCLAEGLIAIVNPVHNWANGPGYSDDDTGADGVNDQVKLQRIWEQVAAHFSGYDKEMVVFEIMNEPHEDDDVAQIIDIGLTAIRASSGNEDRIVIVPGDGFSTRQALIDAFNSDQIPADDPFLIGTFHYYDPRGFTKQGGSGETPGLTWGTGAEFQEVVTKFDEVAAANAAFALRHGTEPLPVYLGEFGVDNEADNWHDDRERWLSWVRMQAEAHGFSWAHWNMYQNTDSSKGMGPWTDTEKNDPSTRYFDASPLEALVGHYEFEDGSFGGGTMAATTQPGFSGSGYTVFPETTGVGVWARAEDLYVPATGTYRLRINYSSISDRTVRLVTAIDGSNHAVLNDVLFPSTGSDDSWAILEVEIDFPGSSSADPTDSGRQNAQFKVVATPETGPNLDWVQITAP